MNWSEFINTYFVQGWNAAETYNWFDTIAYALITIFLVWSSYNIMKKHVKFNYKTALQMIPYITLGSFVRVFADSGVYPRFFWTVTPGVWIIFFVAVLVSLYLDSKFKTNGKITVIVPIIGIIIHLFLIDQVVNPIAILYFIPIYLISFLPFYFLRNKWKLLNNFNLVCIASHLFDATSSFVNVDFFNYIEIHVIGGYFTELFNTAFVMFPLKLIVLLPVLYYIDGEKEKNFKNYLKLIICALGMGPGFRNLLTVILGV